jgi:hypothetical protein
LLLLAIVAGSSFAHPVTLQVTGKKDAQGRLRVKALLDPPHPGSQILVRVFKRKDGAWKPIITGSLHEDSPGVYKETFDPVRGDSRCKVKGRFRRANHTTVRDWSQVFDC